MVSSASSSGRQSRGARPRPPRSCEIERSFFGESIQARAVVPEDRPLGLLVQRESEKARGRLGILGVVVRVIGREDEALGSAQLDRVRGRSLIALEGDEALTEEI